MLKESTRDVLFAVVIGVVAGCLALHYFDVLIYS